ncbi:hypothetical protein LVB87_01230 [Lysobacter sp. KIS68-7]|uniref:hypothetical protein n=1 Tax=Lysobacter sp. KIS68-7 TaxID=2904252 RepID=UPI001E5D9903|nr:hypothetical protein [Lysobacter sp. KIS68-7]UHQ19818.1 hypothetical protein LVB87_01230 [Lysobacter sp. KIS68-7]
MRPDQWPRRPLRLRFVDWVRRWPPALRKRVEWFGMGVLGIAVLLIAFRQPMSERVYPDARGQQLRDAAQLALSQGKLTSPDGTGARELFAAALALDPDRPDARVGLQRVGAAALKQAAEATEQARFGEAHTALRLARELSVPTADTDRIAERLRQREADVAGIDTMLAQAASARAEGHLDGDPQAALPLYKRVLDLQPSRNEAVEGREDALSDLLQQVAPALAKRDFTEAARLVARVREYDPGHVGVPDAQAALTQAADRERTQADRALRRGRIADAGEGYAAAVALDPDDAAAHDGLARTAVAWTQRAEKQAADFAFEDAQHSIDSARTLDPQTPGLADAERKLAQARTESTSRKEHVPVPKPTPAAIAEVRNLLAAAQDAEARGDLLTPPGDSAYDHLRRAKALAPNDPAVQRAFARLLPAARQCFDDALRANRLVRAEGCLDSRTQLGEEATTLRIARRRLALRWVAVGEERLGAGELSAARSALNAARGLDPATEGLDAFALRLNTATRAAEAHR